jgi:hypothetical protein
MSTTLAIDFATFEQKRKYIAKFNHSIKMLFTPGNIPSKNLRIEIWKSIIRGYKDEQKTEVKRYPIT